MYTPPSAPPGDSQPPDFWSTNGTRIQPRLVTTFSDSYNTILVPKIPTLHPVDIPLDIYLLIIEHSSFHTLRSFCRVSKISYQYASPRLWRNVNLKLVENAAARFTNALRDIVRRHGRHVESMGVSLFFEERWEELPTARPMEAATSVLVEMAIEKMPKLRSFSWGANQTPSNDVLEALKTRPHLRELTLDSDCWNTSLIVELNFGGFHHLTSLTMENICDDTQVLAIRHILDCSLNLKKLRFGFVEYFWEEWEPETGVDMFDVLFSVDEGSSPQAKIPGAGLEELTVVHSLLDEHDLEPSFLSVARLCFRNLDSLTIHTTNSGVRDLPALGQPRTFRLRKLQLKCPSWKGFEGLLRDSKRLELLHIEVKEVGLNYDELIPLVCESGERLRDLRLEWGAGVTKGKGKGKGEEWMEKDAVWTLVVKCSRIKVLSLRADFDTDTWCHVEAVFSSMLTDLTHFKLQRMITKVQPPPKIAPPPPSSTSSTSTPTSSASSASSASSSSTSSTSSTSSSTSSSSTASNSIQNQYPKCPSSTPATTTKICTESPTGPHNGTKSLETTAGEFFAASIAAAGGADESSGSEVTKLKYIGIDRRVFELGVTCEGVWAYYEVPKERVGGCGGPWAEEEEEGKKNLFRLMKSE